MLYKKWELQMKMVVAPAQNPTWKSTRGESTIDKDRLSETPGKPEEGGCVEMAGQLGGDAEATSQGEAEPLTQGLSTLCNMPREPGN